MKGLRENYNVSICEMICLVVLALCPILQHYRGIYINLAVTALLIVLPYICLKIIRKRIIKINQIRLVFPLIAFFIYKVIDHGTTITEAGQAIVFSIVVISIAIGCWNNKYFIHIATTISIIASMCIILQYLSYYIFNKHIQMVPTSLLLDRSSQWILAAKTGRASITGRATRFYRPSAFFLEPSHMFIYMFMPLVLLMFSPDFGERERRYSILISIGMIFSTSGMGILTTIGLWLLFFGKKKNNNRKFSISKLLQPKSLLLLIAFLVGLLILCFEVPFFQNSIIRIFGSSRDYTNAIAGRVESGNKLIRGLSGMDFLFGVSDSLSGITYNMSGFNATMYQYGILGTIISYMFYVIGLCKLRNQYFWICTIIIILSFFSAHTHSTFFMIYSTFVIVEGYRESSIIQ